MLDHFPGDFTDNKFNSLLVQALTTEPMIRHAVLAVGSAQRMALVNGLESKDVCFALQHYGQALSYLKTELGGKPNLVGKNTLAMACMLLACFEYIRRQYDAAMFHLQGALGMLKADFSRPIDGQQPANTAEYIEEPLVDVFECLDLMNSFFTSTCPILPSRSHKAQGQESTEHIEFRNLSEARSALRDWTADLIKLRVEIDTKLHTSTPAPSIDLLTTLQSRQLKLQTFSTEWTKAFSTYTSDNPICSGSGAADKLRIRVLVSQIMLDTLLSSGHEIIYDAHLSSFTRVIDLGEHYIRTQPHNTTNRVSLEMGIIAPFLFVGSKCRDPALRRRAAAVLSASGHREGPWEARQAALWVRKIIALEESKAEEMLGSESRVWTAADVPEAARLYQAYFDSNVSENTVFCKRRLFESGGQWVSYEAHVG